MTNILPLQQNQPIVDTTTGYFTAFFKRYMDSILARIGGVTGGTYSPLAVAQGSVLWDLNNSPVANVTLASGVNTLSPPVNMVAGLVYRLTVIQPASGAPGTISWPKPPFIFPGGTPPTLSTGNGAIDELWFSCDGTNMKLCVADFNFS